MDITTYILSRKYVEATADALGAVKGRPCTISGIEPVEGGNRVTFRWTGDSGAVQTSSMTVKDGVSIQDAVIDGENHLVLTLSDGGTLDCGEVPVADDAADIAYENAGFPDVANVGDALDEALGGMVSDASDVPYENEGFPALDNVKDALDSALAGGSALSEPLVVSNTVGSAMAGKTYPKGTSLEAIIRDMLIKEEAPTLTLTITPSRTLYDVVEETVSAITMSAAVGKKTYPLSKVEFYDGNTLRFTQPVTIPGTYTYNMTWAPATNSDFTLKAVAYDSRTGTPLSTSRSVTVKFVAKSYYGTVDSTVGEPTEAIIKSLGNRTLKDTKNLTYSGITMDYGKVVYAYPASFGNLSSIKDVPNNIQYWPNSFTKTVVNVDGISYNCYTQNDPSAAEDIQLTFS